VNDTAERDERVAELVSRALRQPPERRDEYLRLACGGDEGLRSEVSEAVSWEQRMGNFLLQPVAAQDTCERPFQTGELVAGRFEIVREVGEGGMGVVYEAFDRKRRQRIAIKAAKPGFHWLLSPELESALRVRHPNICLVNEIHTARTSQGEVDFLTMEFLEGETLAAHLHRRGPLTCREACPLAQQLCAGLAEAHRSGIIHRDLKSANVFLCPQDGRLRVVIADFGLARGSAIRSVQTAGTPAYMAPELLRGEPASQASDIYSLGMILQEMTSGRLAAPEAMPAVPAAASRARGLERRWRNTVARCLDAQPAARPADAAAVLAALEGKRLSIMPWAALVLLAVGLVSEPTIRERVREHLWPTASVRLAMFPLGAAPGGTGGIGNGLLQTVADRIEHLSGAQRSIAVIAPSESLYHNVHSAEQAKELLHATHALRMTLQEHAGEIITVGDVIDLNTGTTLRRFSGRYSSATAGALPGAVTSQIALALGLHTIAPVNPVASGAMPLYLQGLDALRSTDSGYREAIPLLEKAAALDPRSSLPFAALVEARVKEYESLKNPASLDAARTALASAESLDPDSVDVRLAAGSEHEAGGRYEQALEEYRHVQELEPRNIRAQLRVAHLYDLLDLPERAVAAYRTAINQDPAYYEAYELLGEFYFFRGQFPEAAEQFRQTIARTPGNFNAYANLGATLVELQRHAEAESVLLQSLKLHPSGRALNDLGAMRVFQHRDADALEFYLQAVKLEPENFVFWVNIGDARRRLGRMPEAREAFQKGMDLALARLQQEPRVGYTRAFVAYYAAVLGDTRRAQAEIAQALQLSPADNEVIRCAVLTYEYLGQRDDAIQVLAGATPSLLRDLDHQPDLTMFRQDSRFRELLAKSTSPN
jgi:serine/threonine protein kinase/Tfp pilus assembly protein PilF